jgi:hypothetical protein
MLTDIAAATAEEVQFIELQFSDVTTRLTTGRRGGRSDWPGADVRRTHE